MPLPDVMPMPACRWIPARDPSHRAAPATTPRPFARQLTRPGALLAALAVWFMLAGSAAAFRLSPIEMVFEPSGRGATQVFQVDNDNDAPAAVEIQIFGRTMGRDGEDLLDPAGADDWVVFPEQIILQPGERQTVRVQWIGPQDPPRELPYRLIAEQLDVDLGETPQPGGQVKLLVRYVAALYVAPPGVAPDIRVAVAGPEPMDGGTALAVTLVNEGTARKLLRDARLTVTAGDRRLELGPERLAGLAGENLLAGTERVFRVPWPAEVPVGPVTVSLSVP